MKKTEKSPILITEDSVVTPVATPAPTTPAPTTPAPTVDEILRGISAVDQSPQTKTAPPKMFERNKYGLIEGADYKYKEDGSIDWKNMIDPKFVYVNPDTRRRSRLETKYNKPLEQIKPFEDRVDDADLVISLGGLKQLLRIRGYESVHYTICETNERYAGVNCSIYFVPSYEVEMRSVKYSDNACAHLDNANGFGKNYLLETATNRAFARCIRNFLNINIVSQEELGGVAPNPAEATENISVSLLKQAMDKYKVSWEKIHAKLIEDKVDGAESFTSINDIPPFKNFELIERIKKAAESKAESKAVKTEAK